MIQTRNVGLPFLLLIAGSSMALADSINKKELAFLKAKVGMRVGGGECAQAVSEALRVAGAAFAGNDLGADNPEPGDYVWGTLIKVVSSKDGKLEDSDPAVKIEPGDVLQFRDTRFVTQTQEAYVTRTKIASAEHHTAIVAKVDAEGRYPTEVYEQNAPSREQADVRKLARNEIDFTGLKTGWVRFYRPKPRVDAPGKFVASIVNNTPEDLMATIKIDGEVISKLSLTHVNTASSYTLPSLMTSSTTMQFSIVLDNGDSVAVENGAAYEVFINPKGTRAIRKLMD